MKRGTVVHVEVAPSTNNEPITVGPSIDDIPIVGSSSSSSGLPQHPQTTTTHRRVSLLSEDLSKIHTDDLLIFNNTNYGESSMACSSITMSSCFNLSTSRGALFSLSQTSLNRSSSSRHQPTTRRSFRHSGIDRLLSVDTLDCDVEECSKLDDDDDDDHQDNNEAKADREEDDDDGDDGDDILHKPSIVTRHLSLDTGTLAVCSSQADTPMIMPTRRGSQYYCQDISSLTEDYNESSSYWGGGDVDTTSVVQPQSSTKSWLGSSSDSGSGGGSSSGKTARNSTNTFLQHVKGSIVTIPSCRMKGMTMRTHHLLPLPKICLDLPLGLGPKRYISDGSKPQSQQSSVVD